MDTHPARLFDIRLLGGRSPRTESYRIKRTISQINGVKSILTCRLSCTLGFITKVLSNDSTSSLVKRAHLYSAPLRACIDPFLGWVSAADRKRESNPDQCLRSFDIGANVPRASTRTLLNIFTLQPLATATQGASNSLLLLYTKSSESVTEFISSITPIGRFARPLPGTLLARVRGFLCMHNLSTGLSDDILKKIRKIEGQVLNSRHGPA